MEARRAEVAAYLEARRTERDAARETRRAAAAGDAAAAPSPPPPRDGASSASAAAHVVVAALPPDAFWAALTAGVQGEPPASEPRALGREPAPLAMHTRVCARPPLTPARPPLDPARPPLTPARPTPSRAAATKADLAAAAAGGTVTDERGGALYTQWHTVIAALQATLNASATGLPPYDVRKAQAALDTLAVAAEETRGRVMPRKKFQFSHRPTTAGAAPAAAGSRRAPSGPSDEPTASSVAVAAAGPGTVGSGATTSAAAATATAHDDAPRAEADSDAHVAAANEDDYTLAHRVGETIVVSQAALEAHFAARGGGHVGKTGVEVGAHAHIGGTPSDAAATQQPPHPHPLAPIGDLRLLELTDCLVLIPAPMRALRVDRLTRCVVLAGPVGGSLLLHDCSHVTLAVASRQVRLHRSTHCDLYLRPSSRPIIEHCSGLRLAPCGLEYPALQRHLVDTGLQGALARAEAPLVAGVVAAGAHKGEPAAVGCTPAASPPLPPCPLWRSVDDFDWLRAQASPNWSALPQAAWMRSAAGAPTPQPQPVVAGTGAAVPDEAAVVAPLASVGLVALPAAAASLCGMRVAYDDQPWLLHAGGGEERAAAAAPAGGGAPPAPVVDDNDDEL